MLHIGDMANLADPHWGQEAIGYRTFRWREESFSQATLVSHQSEGFLQISHQLQIYESVGLQAKPIVWVDSLALLEMLNG
jgi:hypothetical protein